MVSIVSGNGLGLNNSSAALLGQQGLFGNAALGQTKENVYLNIANGNLALRERDDFLAAPGTNQDLTRTYNSQGVFSQDQFGANWHEGLIKRITVNTQANTVTRTDADGSTAIYAYDSATASYLSHDGAGNVKSLKYDSSTITWTWRDNAKNAYGEYETYNSTGLIIKAGDLTGVRLQYTYDASGVLSNVLSVKSGESTHFTYTNGNLTSIEVSAKDSASVMRTYSRVHYGYDSLNRLTSVTIDLSADDGVFGSDTYTTRYTYDGSSSRIASVTQDDGSKVVIGYVGVPAGAPTEWKVSSLTDALGRTTQISYTSGATVVTDPLGNQSTYRYDAAGRLTEVDSADVNGAAAGGVQLTRYTYDANGNVKTVDDGQGHVTTYAYDAQDNCISQRDQAGSTITRTFDAANNLLTETRYFAPDTGAGTAGLPAATTNYVYDTTNRLRFRVTPEGRVTEYAYSTTEKNQLIATYQYNYTLYTDTQFTYSQLTTWGGNSTNRLYAGCTTYGYDARGLVTTVTTYPTSSDLVGTGASTVIRYVYDRAGQLIKSIDGNNNATSYVYDGLGRLITTTDPLSNTQNTTYANGAGGVIVTSQLYTGTVVAGVKAGAATVAKYDLAGQLIASGNVSDTATALTTYQYDAAGHLRMSQNAVGQRQFWLYDAAGRQVASIDSTGALTESIYNDANQLIKTVRYATRVKVDSLTDASGLPTNVTLGALRPALTADDRNTWNFYDAAGRLYDQVDAEGYVTRRIYDGASQLVQTIRFATAVNAALLDSGAPAPTASAQDRSERMFYDKDGKVTGRLDAEGYLTEYKYDVGGRLADTINYATATSADLRATGTLAALRPAAAGGDTHFRQYYNAENQVIRTLDGENYLTVITYDTAGNVTQRIRYANPTTPVNAPSLPSPPSGSTEDRTTTYTYTKANRLLQETAPDGTVTQYTYDSSGNVTQIQRALGITADERDNNVRYDAFGRVIAQLPPEGSALLGALPAGKTIDDIWNQYATFYAYNAAGQRISATDPDKHTSYFYYDENGRLAATVNAAGEVQRQRYNAFGQLESSTSYSTRLDTTGLAGGALDAAFAARLDQLAGPNDHTTSYRYDRKGQVVDTTDATGYHSSATYDAFGDVLTSARQKTDKSGYITTAYQYDHRGNLVQTLPFANPTFASTVNYDGFGRAILRTDANGNSTTLGYDHLGHVISMTSPLSPAALTTYDAFGRVLTETDSLGNTTTYVYNKASRSMKITTSEGVIHTTVFNRFGQTVSIQDATNTTTYTYDRNGNLTRVTDGLGTRQANSYDAAGLALTTTDANGNVTQFNYDAANRVLSRVVDPQGLALETRYSYDAFGQAVTVRDSLGNVTTTTYDSAGQVVGIQAADGAVTTFAYDSRGHVVTKTNPEGDVATYGYDENGYASYSIIDGARTDVVYDSTGKNLLLRTVNGQATRYAYDQNNRLVWQIDPTGAVTGYTYDADDRLVTTTRYANASTLITATTPANQVFSAAAIQNSLQPDTGRDSTISNIYDKDGRVYATVDGHMYGSQDGTGTLTVNKSFDAAGRVTETVTYTLTISNIGNFAIDDLKAQVNAMSMTNAKRVVYLYDARGHMTSMLTAKDYSTDDVPLPQWSVQAFAYDGNGNLVGTTRYATVYKTDTPTSVKTWMASSTTPTASDAAVLMTYDRANRLVGTATAQNGVGSSRTWSVTTQQYDAAGNVIERHTAATVLTGATVTATQIASVPTSSADSVVRYQYDAQGRVKATATAQGVNASGQTLWAVATREFSPAGLVLRTVQYASLYAGSAPTDISSIGAQLAGSNDRVTRYAYDPAGRLILSVDAENDVTRFVYDALGNAIERVSYGRMASIPQDLQHWLPSGGADVPRVTRTLYDANNRPVLQIDSMGGVTESRYDAFGNQVMTIAYANQITAAQLAQLSDSPSIASIRAVLQTDAQRDRVTRYVYDTDGHLRFTVDALGYLTENRYDILGRLTSQLAYASAISVSDATLQADVQAVAKNQIANSQTVDARITTFKYDLQGNLLNCTDASGVTTGQQNYTYDGAGRQLTYQNQVGARWNYTYDAAGHRTSETSPAVYVFTNALATTGNGGSGTLQSRITRYAYDAFGNLTSKTEAAGTTMERTTGFAYDLTGRLVETTLPSIKIYDAVNDPLSSAGPTTPIERDSGLRKVTTTYDAFGNAVSSKDVGGAVTYSVFDKVGRVAAEIDALGYVAAYARNGFGETEALTRYASAITPPIAPLTQADLAQRLILTASEDRTIRTKYDQLGHAILVSEPVVDVYDPNALGSASLISAGKTTATRFNAFGEVIAQFVYGADQQGNQVTQAAVTRNYYDARGNKIARIDALSEQSSVPKGYLSTFAYDLAGNVLSKVEYANAIGSWTDSTYQTPVADTTLDRTTKYEYDRLNRLTKETSVGVTYGSGNSAYAIIGNISTIYTYDGRGLRTSVKDAAGQITYTYFDNLGQITGTATAWDTVNYNVAYAPSKLTQYKHDIQGNIVLTIEYAKGAQDGVTSTSALPNASTDGSDRVTATAYDIDGNAIQTLDPEQYAKSAAARSPSYVSYDIYGRVAKQWRTVSNSGTVQTSYKVTQYDALGRVVGTVTPNDRVAGKTALQDAVTYVYNSFGELTRTSLGDYYRYDQAGKVWLSTANGIDQVTLHDAQGNTTVSIRSASTIDRHVLQQLAKGSDALLLDGVLRTDTRYDLLGHVIDVSDSNSNSINPTQPKLTVDRWGNVLSVADLRDLNWRVHYTYNYRNELTSQTANTLDGTAPSYQMQWQYDALGRQVAAKDANGNWNFQGYDANGNLITETHADGGVVTSTYNLFNERILVQQPDTSVPGLQMLYAYDHLGRLVQTTTGNSVAVYTATDTGQALLTATSLGGKQLVETFTYDELGRRISTTDANGVVTKQYYDLNGDVTKTVDGLDDETNSTYDSVRHLINRVDANGKQQSWTYDADGRLTDSHDMAGNVTHYSYNAAGQLVQQTSQLGQDIRYTYSGLKVSRIDDVATGLTTAYTYDAAGNRLTEKQSYAAWVTRLPDHMQNNTLTYDMQNRLVTIQDDQYKLTYGYDNNGNRTSLRTAYDNVVFDSYNTYDNMNRQLIVNGQMDSTGKVSIGQYGHQITYDQAGRRTSDQFVGIQISDSSSGYATTANQLTTERYTYDGVGRLSTVTRDALLIDTRHYDGEGRIVESGFLTTKANSTDKNTQIANAAASIGLAAEARVYAFNKNGEVTRQMSTTLAGVGATNMRYVAADGSSGYDKVGNVLGYSFTNLLAGTTDQYTFDYSVGSTYAEKNVSLNNTSSTVSAYDVNGQRVEIDKRNLVTGATTATTYWYDAAGHVQSRKEGSDSTFSLIVNDNVLGNETKTLDNFLGQNYASATSAMYSAAGVYIVQQNDTLKGIAQAIWGDASLWYIIADANGVDNTTALPVGRALKIPQRINTIHNDYQTFMPYNGSAALGDTMPLATPGNADNCGAMGNIVTAAIAVAATYVTTGRLNAQAMDYLGSALGSANAADKAMQFADPVAKATVAKLFDINDNLSRQIAGDFLTKVVDNKSSNEEVQSAFKSYVNGSSWQATSVRSMLFEATANGAHILNGLRDAFDWTNTAAIYALAATRSTSHSRALSNLGYADTNGVMHGRGAHQSSASDALGAGNGSLTQETASEPRPNAYAPAVGTQSASHADVGADNGAASAGAAASLKAPSAAEIEYWKQIGKDISWLTDAAHRPNAGWQGESQGPYPHFSEEELDKEPSREELKKEQSNIDSVVAQYATANYFDELDKQNVALGEDSTSGINIPGNTDSQDPGSSVSVTTGNDSAGPTGGSQEPGDTTNYTPWTSSASPTGGLQAPGGTTNDMPGSGNSGPAGGTPNDSDIISLGDGKYQLPNGHIVQPNVEVHSITPGEANQQIIDQASLVGKNLSPTVANANRLGLLPDPTLSSYTTADRLNQTLHDFKQDVQQGIVDVGAWGLTHGGVLGNAVYVAAGVTYVADDILQPGNLTEVALTLASPELSKVAGTGINLLNKVPGLGTDLGKIVGKITSGGAPKSTGAFLDGASGGSGLGKLEGRTVNISDAGLNIVENHLGQFGDVPENTAMLDRLRNAQAAGQPVSGADAVFYTHEISEATMMGKGVPYGTAHQAALDKYGVSPFSVYHPDVISSMPEAFSSAWFKFWGLSR